MTPDYETITPPTKVRRLTRTQLYKFVRQNPNNLYLKVGSHFDGMTDCVEQRHGDFEKAVHKDWNDHDMGIQGAYCVKGGRDYIQPFFSEGYVGYRVSNCCGDFIAAVKAIKESEL